MTKAARLLKKFVAFLAENPGDTEEVNAIAAWLVEIGYTGYTHPLSRDEIEELHTAYMAYQDGERYRLAD